MPAQGGVRARHEGEVSSAFDPLFTISDSEWHSALFSEERPVSLSELNEDRLGDGEADVSLRGRTSQQEEG